MPALADTTNRTDKWTTGNENACYAMSATSRQTWTGWWRDENTVQLQNSVSLWSTFSVLLYKSYASTSMHGYVIAEECKRYSSPVYHHQMGKWYEPPGLRRRQSPVTTGIWRCADRCRESRSTRSNRCHCQLEGDREESWTNIPDNQCHLSLRSCAR